MKKILLGILATALVGNYAFAQGELTIGNTSAGGSKIFTNGVAGGQNTGQSGALAPGAATLQYTFALFVNSTTNSQGGVASGLSSAATPWSVAGWSFTGDYATNGALSGRINGFDNAGTFESISGFAVGVNANVELIGWNNAIGGSTLASFMTAYNGGAAGLYYGYSLVGNITLGDAGATIVNSPIFAATSVGGITGFSLAPLNAGPIPEPGTMALAGLGGLSMLLFRRKK